MEFICFDPIAVRLFVAYSILSIFGYWSVLGEGEGQTDRGVGQDKAINLGFKINFLKEVMSF
jgi:hypothetical protein